MPAANKTPPPDMRKKCRVTGNILHNGEFYTPGMEIIFDPEHEDQIQSLMDIGVLEGPVAREQAKLRTIQEAQTGLAAMSDEEHAKLWQQYVRMNAQERATRERQEARIKEDSNAARMANIRESDDRDELVPPVTTEGE